MEYAHVEQEMGKLPPLPVERKAARSCIPEMFEHARFKPVARQAHLNMFLLGHPCKGVWKLVYDEDNKQSARYKRNLETYHGSLVRPTERIDGPGFLFDAPADRFENEWRHRTYKTRPIFITPLAYLRTQAEFENFLVDRLYWRARDLYETPILPWRDGARATNSKRLLMTHTRVARDLTHHFDDRTYILLSDAMVLLHQRRGGVARGIMNAPTVRDAAQELSGLAVLIQHAKAKTKYGQYLLERSLREIESGS